MGTAATKDHQATVRKQFASDMVRLGLWYVQELVSSRRIAAVNVSDALTRRVNIYRLTTLFDGDHDPALGHEDPRWLELVAQLAHCLGTQPLDDAQAAALQLLEPLLATEELPPPELAFGCWSYQIVGESIADRPGVMGRVMNPRKLWCKVRKVAGRELHGRHAELHFRNASVPQSPFAQPVELLRTLAALLADCRQRYPAVQTVWCRTWLNNRPEFLELFPDNWRESSVDRTPEDANRSSFGRARLNTNNWWGQFERSDGSMNAQLAEQFRASHGRFPLANQRCHATLTSIVQHVSSRLAEAGGSC